MTSNLWELRTFDPNADVAKFERRLPHWSQAGCICFITWRTADSIPESILNRWHADREDWLSRHGINSKHPDWKAQLQQLGREVQGEFVRTFSDRWHKHLDACHGACVLRDPENSKTVADSLLKFDQDRYYLTDYVVMPNHVHLLAAFVDEEGLLDQCRSWKHYTAVKINRRIGRRNRFWQQDGFDHLVRTQGHFEVFRKYIADNPLKARLEPDQFRHYSREL